MQKSVWKTKFCPGQPIAEISFSYTPPTEEITHTEFDLIWTTSWLNQK